MLTADRKDGTAFSEAAEQCLHEVFAIKDSLTKREFLQLAQHIDAPLWQVKAWFALQRGFVRSMLPLGDSSSVLEAPFIGDLFAELDGCPSVWARLAPYLEEHRGLKKGCTVEFVTLLKSLGTASSRTIAMNALLNTKPSVRLQKLCAYGLLGVLKTWLKEGMVEEQTTLTRAVLQVLRRLALTLQNLRACPIAADVADLSRISPLPDVRTAAAALLESWRETVKRQASGANTLQSQPLP
eukprot:jgi/Chlat1/4062/Chrsp26S08849